MIAAKVACKVVLENAKRDKWKRTIKCVKSSNIWDALQIFSVNVKIKIRLAQLKQQNCVDEIHTPSTATFGTAAVAADDVNSTNKATTKRIDEKICRWKMLKIRNYQMRAKWMEFGVDEDDDEDEKRNNNRVHWISMMGNFSIENVSDVVDFAIHTKKLNAIWISN